MSLGEKLYLALSLATFASFGGWLFYVSSRFDRLRGGKPEAKRYEEPVGMLHAAGD